MNFRHLIIMMIISITLNRTSLFAQSDSKNIIIIKSEPSGAMVYFEGENSFVGITPFVLPANFNGVYGVTTIKKGYEKRKNRYFFNGRKKGTLRLTLVPKTRSKAAIRSLVFPGWGQYYSERKASGIAVSFLQFSSVVGTFVAHNEYSDAIDKYNSSLKTYELNKMHFELRDKYWQDVVKKHDQVEDLYNKRDLWIWIAGGVWLYNFLDSMLFFPSFDKDIFNRAVPTLSANMQDGIPKLSFSMSF